MIPTRGGMMLYSDTKGLESHQVRFVIAEKGVPADINHVLPGESCEDLAKINPHQSLPTLVDRDLVLYSPRVIAEYIDERFPHPPLMPVYPVGKAKCRLMIYRLERDWLPLVNAILCAEGDFSQARRLFQDALFSSAVIFQRHPFFLSDDITLVDCFLAPILWRLPLLGIDIAQEKSGALGEYTERLFCRKAFLRSLSKDEQSLRDGRDA